MQTRAAESADAAAKITKLEQHVQQLQYEANTAGALEYRCEGLQQDKQQLVQQLQQLKGNVAQMQSSLHQERLQRQEQAALCAELETHKQQMQHRCHDLEAKLKVVEIRAIEADEEQYRTEQELTSGRSELEILHSQDQAATSQSADTGNPHTRTNDLALAESALLSVKADLDTANQRIYQLQQSTNGQAPSNKQQPAISGQMYPDGLSRLSTGMKGRHSGLPSEAASDSSASSHEDTAQAMEKVKGQVASLKASRDKLLAEVDRQSTEIERLLTHTATLEQSLSQMQQSAQTWESQAQDNLLQLDQLKSLLEESAFWQSQSDASTVSDGAPAGNRAQSTEAQLQKEVLQEKAHATSLEVQVRALCLELTRSRGNAGTLSKSIAPTLRGIEDRLAQLLQAPLQVSR